MKKLTRALVGLAIGAGLAGASLLAAAPASAAPPAKPVCYQYTWNVEELTLVSPEVPGTGHIPAYYSSVGDFAVTGDGFYEAEQGGLRVVAHDGSVTGIQSVYLGGAVVQSYPLEVHYQNDLGTALPSGLLSVDKTGDGVAETTLTFDEVGTLAPSDLVLGVGFTVTDYAQGWVNGISIGGQVAGFVEFHPEVPGTPGTPAEYEWVVTGTGSGSKVPASTLYKRYVVTDTDIVKCTANKR